MPTVPGKPDQPGELRRLVRIRLTLRGAESIVLLRADSLMYAEDLAQLVPVVPASGGSGQWAVNLLPDSDAGGQLLLEILG